MGAIRIFEALAFFLNYLAFQKILIIMIINSKTGGGDSNDG